jgi:hypothetical protein
MGHDDVAKAVVDSAFKIHNELVTFPDGALDKMS